MQLSHLIGAIVRPDPAIQWPFTTPAGSLRRAAEPHELLGEIVRPTCFDARPRAGAAPAFVEVRLPTPATGAGAPG
jgi:hypothetical protein